MLSKAKYLMGIGKPKNQHSLENLKYLYGILNKNQIVTENNKDLLIETLRSISEILIWGDQNDSSVFDFFLERQMITFFLHYMKQKYGRYICVQLLQTLNILFENIRNETSLYFLLSNNHINNIILHKFDFSDEEVMAYYISFLKTLSLKLNSHSIHFFFNERMAEFPLYVEAIKFFDHPESMVRIAVRTLTLNVYKVKVPSMQRFIIEKTASHYFSNLVWLMRNHVLDLDLCVKNTTDHTKRCRLTDLIDEYIDHLSYLQDIYMINNPDLCVCLTEELVRRLLVPICLGSIIKKDFRKACIQPYVAVFALSHIFSIITYEPILSELCELIFFTNDEKYLSQMCSKTVRSSHNLADPNATYSVDYLAEPKPLIHCLNSLSTTSNSAAVVGHQSKVATSGLPATKTRSRSVPHFSHLNHRSSNTTNLSQSEMSETPGADQTDDLAQKVSDIVLPSEENTDDQSSPERPSGSDNKTDDEKFRQIVSHRASMSNEKPQGVIIEAILHNLDTQEYNEMHALISLSFLFTLMKNPGLESKFQDMLCVKVNKSNEMVSIYNEVLMSKLIGIVSKSVEPEFKVRLATLELAIKLIKSLVIVNKRSYISDFHLACIEQAREQSSFILRQKFKSEEMFLDMFEHEYQDLNSNMIINFEMLLRDWSILLPPTSTPLSGIEFARRFPCGDTEKLKQVVCTFFLIRSLCLNLTNQIETQLPLTKQEHLVKENDALDLNSSDLIACTVNLKDKKDRRFLVIDPIQFILVEPEVKRIGWGIVKFSDLIQDVEVSPDKEDSRSLNITIKKTNVAHGNKADIVLNSVFTFDDHIRCMAAKQHLVRARDRARRMKLEKIAQLLDINTAAGGYNTKSNPSYAGVSGTATSTSASAAQTPGSSNADINYNLVAGFNMHMSNNSVYYPGRASMISSTWSQIAQPDKANTSSSIMNSPMSALTSSPVIRNTVVGVTATPTSQQQLFKSQTAHQFSFVSQPSTPSANLSEKTSPQLDSSLKRQDSINDKTSSSNADTPVSATSKSGSMIYEI